jgi:hypothetical protein
MERAGPSTLRGLTDPHVDHLLKFFFGCTKFMGWESSCFRLHWVPCCRNRVCDSSGCGRKVEIFVEFGSCFRMSAYLWSGGMRCTDSIPETVTRVESMSRLCFRSTNRLWWWRKLAPMMGDCMLAMRKFHGRWRRKPRSSLKRRSPYVSIHVPFAE